MSPERANEFPSPDNMRRAPVWDCYVIAQAAAALLGVVPHNALAVGVRAEGRLITMIFRMSQLTGSDEDDIDFVCDYLQDLVGEDINVDRSVSLVSEPGISAGDGIGWLYAKRVDS